MNAKPMIRCSCGQRVVSKDVTQTGYYLRIVGPSFVYVKYRCSRCKKLGEQFVKQQDWEEGILKDTPCEITDVERSRFQSMGEIDVHEAIDFHFALDEDLALGRLSEFVEYDCANDPKEDSTVR